MQEILNNIEDSADSAKMCISDAMELVYEARPINEADIISHLEDAKNYCLSIPRYAMDYEEPDMPEEVELHEINHSTIEWNRDRANINFTDREIMDTLEKLFFNGKSSQEILKHLEQL